jgi:hypothetical protein
VKGARLLALVAAAASGSACAAVPASTPGRPAPCAAPAAVTVPESAPRAAAGDLAAAVATIGGVDGQDAAGGATPADATAPKETSEEVNDGQDPTKPIRRFDVREKYTRLSHDPADLGQWTTTLRCDAPLPIGDGWSVATRVDLPIVENDVPNAEDNPRGEHEWGLGDVLLQALVITPRGDRRWNLAFGSHSSCRRRRRSSSAPASGSSRRPHSSSTTRSG